MSDRALSVGWISKNKKVTTIFLWLSAGFIANDENKVVTFSFLFLEIHSIVRARSKPERPDFGQKAVLGINQTNDQDVLHLSLLYPYFI